MARRSEDHVTVGGQCLGSVAVGPGLLAGTLTAERGFLHPPRYRRRGRDASRLTPVQCRAAAPPAARKQLPHSPGWRGAERHDSRLCRKLSVSCKVYLQPVVVAAGRGLDAQTAEEQAGAWEWVRALAQEFPSCTPRRPA